jgi:succinate dehydrogenase/fumarate reductase flavoprotein subunit
MPVEKVIETDVLVIGGGMAGCFAAIKAREHVDNVTIVDKGFTGKSGATHFAEGDFTFLNHEAGHDIEAWLAQMNQANEYLNNQQWCRILLEDSHDRYKDLVSWGVRMYQEDGKIQVGQWGLHEHHCMMNREFAPVLRQKSLDVGVNIIDRVMFSELLKQDDRIVGGVGFHTTSGDLYIFKSKSVVLAAGGSSLKIEAMPIHSLTSDGHALAYRAGAEIAGKEFIGNPSVFERSKYEPEKKSEASSLLFGNEENDVDILTRYPSFRSGLMGAFIRPTLNAEGGQVITPAWEAHCGRAPLYMDNDGIPPDHIEHSKGFYKRIGTEEIDKIGLNVYESGKRKYSAGRENAASNIDCGSGIWPADLNCASNIPGLYSAGNNCATMVCSATYWVMGIGLCHAAVTGARAGKGAAKFSLKTEKQRIEDVNLNTLKKIVCSPMERKGGFSPRWVTQVLQGITVPYFMLNIKHEDRLQAALTLIEFMNQHLVPKLKANDPHEWRLAQETKNMTLNAEMAIRASLFRTESRGAHYREEFPYRNDPEWLAWVKLKKLDGEMHLTKEPIPEKWWPDLSIPYEERYPFLLPNETVTTNKNNEKSSF